MPECQVVETPTNLSPKECSRYMTKKNTQRIVVTETNELYKIPDDLQNFLLSDIATQLRQNYPENPTNNIKPHKYPRESSFQERKPAIMSSSRQHKSSNTNVTSAERISELTDEDVRKLTHLLHIKRGAKADEAWFKEQTRVMGKLPSKLLKPTSPFSLLGLKLHVGSAQATLCKCHKALNPRLIRCIFIQLSKEVTVRTERLSKWPCPRNVELWLRRVHKINSLWLSPEMYRTAFQVTPSEERYDQVVSECEACILSRIGGDVQAILDLEISAWSRRKTGTRDPRLLRFTDAWLDWFKTKEDVRERNKDFGREVRAVRKLCLEERRQQRKERQANSGKGKGKAPAPRSEGRRPSSASSLQRDYSQAQFVSHVAPQARNPYLNAVPPKDPFAHVFPNPFEHVELKGDEDDDDEDADNERAVTDYYTRRLSRAVGLGQDLRADGMHSAFRSLASDETRNPYTYQPMKRSNTTAGKSHHSGQAAERGRLGRSSSVQGNSSSLRPPPQRKHSNTYSSSVYSQAPNDAYRGGAYDINAPYVPPLRVPTKKPTRTAGPPPTSSKANKFFKRTEAEASRNHHLDRLSTSGSWTDDTVRSEETITPESSARRAARAARTSEDHALAYRALVGQGNSPTVRPGSSSSSHSRRSGSRRRSDRMSQDTQGTNWGNFYK
ncbi:hypothetical protein HYFRA_00004394 [Hymenoscyphus fraxineus]|uniref:Uncharacterized protein n=1 Tax=Hymenoscyphus fraxineus TaxID=746836 RepID=A0A9N9KYU8_9HELO|nr:hypothetical protein HYFRA_00004394 [Hymenoscyphus fraxineus]